MYSSSFAPDPIGCAMLRPFRFPTKIRTKNIQNSSDHQRMNQFTGLFFEISFEFANLPVLILLRVSAAAVESVDNPPTAWKFAVPSLARLDRLFVVPISLHLTSFAVLRKKEQREAFCECFQNDYSNKTIQLKASPSLLA